MPLKSSFYLFCLLSFISLPVLANKISAQFGFYDIKAQALNSGQTSTTSLTQLGSYQLSASFSLFDPIEVGAGYSLFYSKTVSGDMGFGPDLFLRYFPFVRGSKTTLEQEGVKLKMLEAYRPYVGFSFHQRQFQSVQTSYSGFGLSSGVEWMHDTQWGYLVHLNYQSLVGPDGMNFNFMDLGFGLQWYFD